MKAAFSNVHVCQFPEQSKGVVELTIGYHQLTGKLVPLKKPLAVLEKVLDDNEGRARTRAYQASAFPPAPLRLQKVSASFPKKSGALNFCFWAGITVSVL